MDNLLKQKILLIYPPSIHCFQRGEDRCQSNIDSSTATSIRACNDLGYAASILLKNGYNVRLVDYQTEQFNIINCLEDIFSFKPDVVFISVTNASIYDDIEFANKIKDSLPNSSIILKGAIFFDPEMELLEQLNLNNIDYLIGGETEFIIGDLINAHFNNKDNLNAINGILYKKNNKFIKTKFDCWEKKLDMLPFPARELMNNSLYIRPDTQEIQATIATSRGCPSSCIFCLTPKISGKYFRTRSAQNVFEEIKECYDRFNIKNFFFKADTFTMDKKWTQDLCNLIINSDLKDKIRWVANSRVNTVDELTLKLMKKAGCWLIAFGFESGSKKSLKMMKKGTTIEQNILAAKLAKKAGLKIFGFYLIGFPWENKKDLKDTEKLIYKINADFIEIHIATPFYGTELYKLAKSYKLINNSVLGNDYFNAPSIGTKYLPIEYIIKFRKRLLLQYHIRINYILKKCFFAINKPKVIKNYIIYGLKLLYNVFSK